MHKEHKKYLNSGFDHCITLHWVWFLGEFDCDISHYWWILVSMMWNGKELPLSCGSQIQNTYTVLYLGTVVSTADCQGECLYRQADKGSHCWTPLGHLLQTMRLQLQYQYCQCAVGGIGKEGRNVVCWERNWGGGGYSGKSLRLHSWNFSPKFPLTLLGNDSKMARIAPTRSLAQSTVAADCSHSHSGQFVHARTGLYSSS